MIDMSMGEHQSLKRLQIMPETLSVEISFFTLEQAGIDSYPKFAVVENEMRTGNATSCSVELQPHLELIRLDEDESFLKKGSSYYDIDM